MSLDPHVPLPWASPSYHTHRTTIRLSPNLTSRDGDKRCIKCSELVAETKQLRSIRCYLGIFHVARANQILHVSGLSNKSFNILDIRRDPQPLRGSSLFYYLCHVACVHTYKRTETLTNVIVVRCARDGVHTGRARAAAAEGRKVAYTRRRFSFELQQALSQHTR